MEAMTEHERLMAALASATRGARAKSCTSTIWDGAGDGCGAPDNVPAGRGRAVRANLPAAYSAATLRSGSRGVSSSRTMS